MPEFITVPAMFGGRFRVAAGPAGVAYVDSHVGPVGDGRVVRQNLTRSQAETLIVAIAGTAGLDLPWTADESDASGDYETPEKAEPAEHPRDRLLRKAEETLDAARSEEHPQSADALTRVAQQYVTLAAHSKKYLDVGPLEF